MSNITNCHARRIRPYVQHATLLNTIRERRGMPFVYLLLTNGTLSTILHTLFRTLYPFKLLYIHCGLSRNQSQKYNFFSTLENICERARKNPFSSSPTPTRSLFFDKHARRTLNAVRQSR